MKKIKLTRRLQKKYVKSGWFFLDFIATTPFYLNTDTGNNGIWLKLLRMIRIPRVIGLFDVTHFNKIMEKLISGQPRSKQVYLGLVFKNLYKVCRLILLKLIIIYYLGCFYYFFSDLQILYNLSQFFYLSGRERYFITSPKGRNPSLW